MFEKAIDFVVYTIGQSQGHKVTEFDVKSFEMAIFY